MKRLQTINYHRNGVGGEGFYIILFKEDKRNMMCIKFSEWSQAAILDRDLLEQDITEFGKNSHRGDNYADWIEEQIKTYNEAEEKKSTEEYINRENNAVNKYLSDCSFGHIPLSIVRDGLLTQKKYYLQESKMFISGVECSFEPAKIVAEYIDTKIAELDEIMKEENWK